LQMNRRSFFMRQGYLLASVVIAVACAALPSHAQAGADTYKAKCMMCHAADGSGSTPAGKSMGAIPFTNAALVKASDADLIAATTNGKGKMPAYKNQLTAPQIAAVVAYLRTLQK
jgi:mono/diheme cytochrome c family protein